MNEEKIYNVYIISNCINNKVYIGMTKRSDIRWKDHKSHSRKEKPKCFIHKAMNKYGIENFQFDIVESNLTFLEAIHREQRLIAIYNTTNPKFGYNILKGGRFVSTWVEFSQESRNKLKANSIGRKHSIEAKAKMSLRKKLQWKEGVYDSEDYKDKMISSRKGKNRENGLNIKVKCIESEKEYSSLTHAALEMGFPPYARSLISQNLANKIKDVYGYTFSYID